MLLLKGPQCTSRTYSSWPTCSTAESTRSAVTDANDAGKTFPELAAMIRDLVAKEQAGATA